MKLNTLHSELTRLVRAAISAADWLADCPEGSDQRERGDALLVALVPYLHLNGPAVDTSTEAPTSGKCGPGRYTRQADKIDGYDRDDLGDSDLQEGGQS